MTEFSRPRDLQALAFETDNGLEVWLANLTGERQQVHLNGLSASALKVALNDEENFLDCAENRDALDALQSSSAVDRLTLAPYATARCRTTN